MSRIRSTIAWKYTLIDTHTLKIQMLISINVSPSCPVPHFFLCCSSKIHLHSIYRCYEPQFHHFLGISKPIFQAITFSLYAINRRLFATEYRRKNIDELTSEIDIDSIWYIVCISSACHCAVYMGTCNVHISYLWPHRNTLQQPQTDNPYNLAAYTSNYEVNLLGMKIVYKKCSTHSLPFLHST